MSHPSAIAPLEIIPSVCGVPHESACAWVPYYKGVLRLFPDRLEFDGKGGTLVMRDIRDISCGSRPGSAAAINLWVKVVDGGGSTLYLLDGGWLCWRGILGGTRRLYERLKAEFPVQTDA